MIAMCLAVFSVILIFYNAHWFSYSGASSLSHIHLCSVGAILKKVKDDYHAQNNRDYHDYYTFTSSVDIAMNYLMSHPIKF